MKAAFAALLCGALFGVGLAIARMTDPLVVIGFLDVFGDFDPTLAFVLIGATMTTAVAFHFVTQRARPIVAAEFQLPATRMIDLPLVLGAAIFGVGWGLAGYCPGPALVGAGAGTLTALLFLPAMIVGSIAHRLVAARFSGRKKSPEILGSQS
ncbi:MAG TPA: DUF6691 family protein [Rudaea sp.]|nr:DUF6691 family protein [Rudaea sp.]